MWATPNTCSPSLTVGPRVTFSSFSALTFFFPDCTTSTPTKISQKHPEFVQYVAKFSCAIFPHSTLVCKTFPDKRSLDEKNWTHHLVFGTEPWQMLQRRTVFQCTARKMEGMRTMMPELGLRRRGKNSRGAAAAKRRKRASPQERLTLVASPKP